MLINMLPNKLVSMNKLIADSCSVNLLFYTTLVNKCSHLVLLGMHFIHNI